jgi:hypothetical protein
MVIRHGAGAALNTDGAARHGLRVLRHPPLWKVNRSGDRHRLESDWVVRRCGSRPRPSSIQGCLTRAASGARSKRDGTSRCGDRQVRHPPFLLTAEVPAASEGVESLRTIYAGRSVRNPRGLIRRDDPVQPRGPQPNMGSAIRTGWCRRRAVNAVPAGKRFDSVHFPPCGCSSMVEQSVANAPTSSSILPGRSNSPRKLIW